MGHLRGNCQWAGLALVPENSQSLAPWVTCHLTCPVFAASLSLKPRAVALGEQPAYQGPVHCIATIVRTEGLAGLYRGAGAMMLRDVPGYCLYFIPYVFLTDWITPETCADPSPYAVWLAGGVAGKTAALIPFPVLAPQWDSWVGLPCSTQPSSNNSMLNTYCVSEKGLGKQDSPPLSPISSPLDLWGWQVLLWAFSTFSQKIHFEHLLCVRCYRAFQKKLVTTVHHFFNIDTL